MPLQRRRWRCDGEREVLERRAMPQDGTSGSAPLLHRQKWLHAPLRLESRRREAHKEDGGR